MKPAIIAAGFFVYIFIYSFILLFFYSFIADIITVDLETYPGLNEEGVGY